MADGFGGGPWGSTPWGGGKEGVLTVGFESPLYPSIGVGLGGVKVSSFSGEPQSGPLAALKGGLFFSAGLLEDKVGSELDVEYVRVSARAEEVYERPPEPSSRVFTFSGTSVSPARTNDALYRTQPGEYTVVATMVQTLPPGPTTVFKIP